MAGGKILVADVQCAVAELYGLPVATMREPAPTSKCGANPWPISRARQTAMALSILLTDHSYPRVGQFFGGRDPTTVRAACKATERRRRSDPKLHNAMRRVTLALLMERVA